MATELGRDGQLGSSHGNSRFRVWPVSDRTPGPLGVRAGGGRNTGAQTPNILNAGWLIEGEEISVRHWIECARKYFFFETKTKKPGPLASRVRQV
jgi:hypothetical protein